MSAGWRTVRVFISSTFRDMQAERDWLVKRVFPALRQRLEPHRINLVDIDLRWGITREQADNDQVLGLCLQQIDECRPFFVGLLGGRYGWVPSKFPVEVGRRYGWTQNHTGKSVTELEILHGVLNDPAMHGRALFCFRSEDFLRGIKDAEKRRVYVEGPTDEELHELGPEEAERRAAVRRQQLADLKNGIRALSPPMPLLDGYPCTWEAAGSSRREEALTSLPKLAVEKNEPPDVGCYGGSGGVGGLAGLGNWILDKLERAILDAAELQEHLASVRTETRDELAEERGFHERFIESRTRVYIGRQRLQDELKAFVTGAEAKPCLVTGPSGSGKSAALAKFVHDLASAPSDILHSAFIIHHFVGTSPRSTGLRDVLRHLCAELKDALKLEDEIKQDTRELCNQFREFLAKVPADRRVVLVIDALNQLDEADNAHSLYWLPGQIPPPVRLIVSCIEDPDRTDQPALAAMRSRQPREIKVGLLTDDERLGIVREIPSVAAKTLDEQQVRLLLANEATRNPLFLLVALEELRGFGSFEQLNQKIAGLPQTGDTLTAIFQQVIRRLGKDFNAATVKDVLTLLACARIGLSERELQDLLSPNRESGIGSPHHASRITHHDDLFPILRQLRPYLQSRGPLLDFYHRNLFKAVRQVYLSEERTVQAIHRELADYFHGQADPSNDKQWKGKHPRPFLEFVFHLAGARLDDELCGALCDLRFVEARCQMSQVFELIADYRLAQENLPEAQAGLREERAREQGVRRWTAEIIEYAQLWSARRDRLARGDTVTEPEPKLPEPVPTCEMWSEEKIQAECERIIQSPTRRDRLEAFAGFVTGQCYPLLEHGQRPGFVLQHAFNTEPAGAVRDAAVPLLASLTEPHLLRRWPPEVRPNPSPALLRTLTGHRAEVVSVSVTPDGRWAVSGSQDNTYGKDDTVRVWDLVSGQCLRTLTGHSSWVSSVDMTPDGRWAVSGSWDKTVRVWDLASGQCLWTLTGHSDDIRSVSITPDGRLAVSGSGDKTLRVWDLASGLCLRTLIGNNGEIDSVSVTPDGRWAMSGSGSGDYTLRLWDLASGRCLRTLNGHSDRVKAAKVTPDGRRSVSGSLDETVRVWDLASGQCRLTLTGQSGGVRSVDVTPDGRRAVSGSNDNALRVWDLANGRCLRRLAGHSGEISSVSVTPDGRRAVSAGGRADEAVRVWDLASGQCLRTLTGHSASVDSVSVTPDGRRAVSGSADETVLVWDLTSGQCLWKLTGHRGRVRSVKVTRDGRRAVSWSEDSTIRVWDLDNGQCLLSLSGQSGGVSSVDVTPDGRWAVSGSKDNRVRVWDLTSGHCLRWLTGHRGRVFSVSMTQDGRRAVSGSAVGLFADNRLRVWDLASGQCLRKLTGHRGRVRSVKVTRDGRQALSVSDDHTLQVWDLGSGQCLRTLTGHSGDITSVSVTPDGRRAVSASEDHTVRVWGLASGECLCVYPGPLPFLSVALDGAGNVICAGSQTGEVLFLELHCVSSGPAIVIAANPQQVHCPVCGREFAPPPAVLTIQREADAPGLLSHCPHCQYPPQFNADDYAEVLRRGLEQSRREKGADHEETLAHLTALGAHLAPKRPWWRFW